MHNILVMPNTTPIETAKIWGNFLRLWERCSICPFRLTEFILQCPLYSFIIPMALNTNEILSSSFERESSLKLCQATWTTHSHSEKFNKMLKNFANFTWFSLLFSPKKVAGSLVKLSEFTFKVFILCFQSYLFGFCTISSGLRVQFRHLLANLRKIYIYIHDVNIDASQADRALNWTARINKVVDRVTQE